MEAVTGPPLTREIMIIQPEPGARVARGDAVCLAGMLATRLDGRSNPITAFWSSNRDGFLADGSRACVNSLSVGRHVLRFTVQDEAGYEINKSIAIWVQERSGYGDSKPAA